MKKLLIVVDYQVDFVNGSLGFSRAELLEEKIVDKILEFENNGEDVVFTLDTHYDNYMDTPEGKKLPIKHCIKNTAGHRLYGQVGDLAIGHMCFEKETFGSSALFEYLKNKDYTDIYLCGVVTNICVINNAVIAKAALPNSEIFIYKDLVASNDESIEKMSFKVMESFHVNII